MYGLAAITAACEWTNPPRSITLSWPLGLHCEDVGLKTAAPAPSAPPTVAKQKPRTSCVSCWVACTAPLTLVLKSFVLIAACSEAPLSEPKSDAVSDRVFASASSRSLTPFEPSTMPAYGSGLFSVVLAATGPTCSLSTQFPAGLWMLV